MTVRFSASYMDRLMACPGSANLDLAIPGWQEPVRDPNAGAKGVGTNVHEVFHQVLTWWRTRPHVQGPNMANHFSDLAKTFAALHKSKRSIITTDRAKLRLWIEDASPRLFQLYLNLESQEMFMDTFLLLKDFTPRMMVFIANGLIQVVDDQLTPNDLVRWETEKSYDVTWLQTKPQTTPDMWSYFVDQVTGEKTLVVTDFKSGVIEVPAKESKQLYYYAVTVTEQEPDINPDIVELVIIQPATGGMTRIDKHEITRAELDKWRDKARAAEQKVIDKDLTLQPSDKGCTFCPANPHTRGDKGTPLCPAMMNLLYPPVIDDEIYELL